MAYEIIITEKPAAAEKIAFAIAEGKPLKKSDNKVPYYEITRGNKDIIVASAVGHLYTVSEKNKKSYEYPTFSIEWVASCEVNKQSAFTKKYLNLLKKLAKGADEFTIATDYDIEGEVIGYNVLKYALKQKDANRMKFSTLTKEDLVEAYENKMSSIDWGQANAGVTRHELDWYYGINLSRALTSSIKASGSFKIMSSGRVQGPTLKILAEREKEIQKFKPILFWQIELKGLVNSGELIANHCEDKFWEKKKADDVIDKTRGHDAVIKEIDTRSFKQQPPFPFDLTTLQTESYKNFGISPKETLSIAQELYTLGLISYPRTSSQRLPEKIGYKKILSQLSRNEIYKLLVDQVLKTPLKPNEGKKTDPAHPAIYPTGLFASLDGRKQKVYDLIVKRFFSTFGEPAVRETLTIDIDCNSEIFISKGTRTIYEGWHIFYKPYVKLEEEELPNCKKNENVKVKSIKQYEKETQPPKRYTPASIIKELEKRNLGTKSTRAAIIDTLFERNYIKDKAIVVTDLGLKTIETLEKYSPRIIDEKLTKKFEDEMEEIRENKKESGNIIKEAKSFLLDVLTGFKEKEKEIGNNLISAYRETQDKENTLGNCHKCDGSLMIKKGKYGRFVSCSNYEKCDVTFKLPQKGTIKALKKRCEDCDFPLINIIRKGMKPQKLCINPDCPGKLAEGEKVNEVDKLLNESLEKKCPKCGKELILRKSIYGKFIGCTGYPKCKYTENVGSSNESSDLL